MDTWANLDAVLAANGLPPTGLAVLTKSGLAAYANKKQWAIATGGHVVVIGGVSVPFATDPISEGLITGKAARFGQPSPPATVDWQTPTGFVTISAADFIAAAVEIADFVQATFDTLKTVFASIASGSITTTAEIDAVAWPT